MVNLGYALTILRLFDRRFTKIGFVYVVLGTLFFVLAYVRQRHSRHDFADQHRKHTGQPPIQTVGQTGRRNFGRPFVTAGWIVIALTAVVAIAEVWMLVLILGLDTSD